MRPLHRSIESIILDIQVGRGMDAATDFVSDQHDRMFVWGCGCGLYIDRLDPYREHRVATFCSPDCRQDLYSTLGIRGVPRGDSLHFTC